MMFDMFDMFDMFVHLDVEVVSQLSRRVDLRARRRCQGNQRCVEPSGAQWSPVEPRRRSVPPWMDPRKVAYAVGERMIKDGKG